MKRAIAAFLWAFILFTLAFGFFNRAGRYAAQPVCHAQVDAARLPGMLPLEVADSAVEFRGVLHPEDRALGCKSLARVQDNLDWDAWFLMLYPIALALVLWSVGTGAGGARWAILTSGILLCGLTAYFDFHENAGIQAALGLIAHGKDPNIATIVVPSRWKWGLIGGILGAIGLMQSLAQTAVKADGWQSGRVCAAIAGAAFGIVGAVVCARGLFVLEMLCASLVLLLTVFDFKLLGRHGGESGPA